MCVCSIVHEDMLMNTFVSFCVCVSVFVYMTVTNKEV